VTNPAWFDVLVASTAVLRGVGAGAIWGVLVITLPTRRRIGVVAYGQFTRAHYRGPGVRVYALVTIVGTVMTLLAYCMAIAWHAPPRATLWLLASLLGSAAGFVGTAGALPAMRHLRIASDTETTMLTMLLDRFARWGLLSATCHLIAFIAVVVAAV
jgi:hypothetical protein